MPLFINRSVAVAISSADQRGSPVEGIGSILHERGRVARVDLLGNRRAGVTEILRNLLHGDVGLERERLKRDMPKEKLTRALAYIVLKPDEGKLVLKAADLGFEEDAPEADVRERHVIYAKKLLGRLVGKLPPKE